LKLQKNGLNGSNESNEDGNFPKYEARHGACVLAQGTARYRFDPRPAVVAAITPGTTRALPALVI